jgi:hypothetical protein
LKIWDKWLSKIMSVETSVRGMAGPTKAVATLLNLMPQTTISTLSYSFGEFMERNVAIYQNGNNGPELLDTPEFKTYEAIA